jgi:prepilin-type N-terminal cleavage/methylation domain-containing protein
MLSRIRKATDEKDSGFTLIELLVVMIIIGILAAIAVPVFLNQRKGAVDASEKSDLRTISTDIESYYTDNQAYPADSATGFVGTANAVRVHGVDVRTSRDSSFEYSLNAAAEAYCLVSSNPRDSHDWVYISNKGGLQPGTVTTCGSF